MKDVLVEESVKYSLKTLKSAPIAVDGDGTDKLDFTYLKILCKIYIYIKNDNSKNQIIYNS